MGSLTLFTSLDTAYAMLNIFHISPDNVCEPPSVEMSSVGQDSLFGGFTDVDACGKSPLPGAREKNHPYFRISRQSIEDTRKLRPSSSKKRVKLSRPIDLNVGYEGPWKRCVEVLVIFRSFVHPDYNPVGCGLDLVECCLQGIYTMSSKFPARSA